MPPGTHRTSAPARPASIETGWLSLHDLHGCELLGDPQWVSDQESWVFPVRLRSDAPSEHIPEYSRWVVAVDPEYPAGSVEVYPAREDGLTATFPHQRYNAPPSRSDAWRAGNLCLTTPWGDHRQGDGTPIEAERRLRWTLARAREWLRCAATGTLTVAGDPFELPDFDAASPPDLGLIVAPGVTNPDAWLRHITPLWGTAAWRTFQPDPGARKITLLRGLTCSEDSALQIQPWGTLLTSCAGTDRRGTWLWLPSPPILPPWQVPRTWGELRAWGRKQGMDLEQVFVELCKEFGGQAGGLVLVGFPIPARFADPFSKIAWQALRLPRLRSRPQRPKGGRRLAQVVIAQTGPFIDDEPLSWIKTQTWSRDHLAVRGVVVPQLQDLRVVLIGCGAVGSRLAELLVRAGVRQLHLIDDDTIQAGNLVRHTASLRALGARKSSVLCHELQGVSPFAQVTASTEALPEAPHRAATMLGDAELVIDATAADAVLRTLAALPGEHPRRWMSISLNRHAERLYCHLAHGPRFPLAHFELAMRPWLADDRARHHDPLPWEGAGCWSPVFPARLDDITALVALAVRELERLALGPPPAPELRVYERRCDDDGTPLTLRRCEPRP